MQFPHGKVAEAEQHSGFGNCARYRSFTFVIDLGRREKWRCYLWRLRRCNADGVFPAPVRLGTKRLMRAILSAYVGARGETAQMKINPGPPSPHQIGDMRVEGIIPFERQQHGGSYPRDTEVSYAAWTFFGPHGTRYRYRPPSPMHIVATTDQSSSHIWTMEAVVGRTLLMNHALRPIPKADKSSR